MYRYFTLDNFDFKNKVVGVRVDINSPQIDGKIVMNERIKATAITIRELSKKGAKVVILAHQGRKGKENCVSLKEHSVLLTKELATKVDFISEIFSQRVKSKIASLKQSEILLLENLRFTDDEIDLDKNHNTIKELETLFDFYVNDAFSVGHRNQASLVANSVVGIKKVPIIAGRQMQKELSGLNGILETKKPSVYVFGGAKPDDLIEMLKINIPKKRVDFIILTGVIGEIALLCKGAYLGAKEKFLEEKGYMTCKDEMSKLLKEHSNKFILPKDLALFDGKKRIEVPVELLKGKKDLLDKYIVQDIGEKTIKFNTSFLKDTGSIYMKGPAGNFEDKNFVYGTKEMFKAIISSGAFTFMGGGHSVTALEKFAKVSDFSYVSLAGGALVKFLSGKNLPAIDALEKSFTMHDSHFEDFLVIGSNTLDISSSVPAKFSDFYMGDKIEVNEDFKTSIGGGGINVSICLSRLGGKTAYLGKISEETKKQVHEVLQKDRVDLFDSKISKRPAAKSIIIDTLDNDRIILTYRGQNQYLEESDFNFSKINARNFYFSSLGGTSFKTMLSLAKKLKIENEYTKICLNLTSHLIRNEKNLKTLCKNVDILVLNLEEAQEFSLKHTVSDCLKEIKSMVREIVVITDGANGAYAYDGKEDYHCNSEKVKKIVDTTGAGDSFAATFFYFYTKGFGIQTALKYAAKNSASVIEYKGPQYGLMYYDSLNVK